MLQLLRSIARLLCGLGTPQAVQEPEQRPPAHPEYSQPSSHPPKYTKPKPDLNHINNEYYVSLRAEANRHGDQMAKCFQRSHDAYSRGDGALAKELSNQGKDHQQQMVRLNKEASDYIFVENNKDSKPGELDLHGLYVKEAIYRADEAIQKAKNEGQTEIKFIVGKGLHSYGGVAKIRPAIEELMERHRLTAEVDPSNSGVLIVKVNARTGLGNKGIGADELSRRLDDQEGCLIM